MIVWLTLGIQGLLIANDESSGHEMFFFIGGVHSKTITLDEPAKRCDACGLYQLKPMRTDHYLSLFFIPILPIKKGDLFFRCESCGAVTTERNGLQDVSHAETCPKCGRVVDKDFRFCPSCGHSLNA
ncbi:MAG: zinc ribbon domain-containing protein [Deltaproteobacteria bacterium]|nr:zinc ribbon domain-containing protein [Deltaproteobacteria bacterium]